MLILSSFFAFVLVIFFSALKVEEVLISDFELKRRIENKDKKAEKLLIKKQFSLILNRITKFLAGFFTILLILLIGEILSFGSSILASFGLILMTLLLSNLRIVKDIANNFFAKKEPKILIFYSGLSDKLKQKIVRPDEVKPLFELYSKEELVDLMKKSNKILSKKEEKLIKLIFEISDKKIKDLMTHQENLKNVRQADLLGPLVISEMHKTGQKYFVVTDKIGQKVQGILALDRISNLDNKTSQIAKNVMDYNFSVLNENELALDSLSKMSEDDKNFFIVENDNCEFTGVINMAKIFSR